VKILLDEMYAGLKEYFEILGWDVVTAIEIGLQGAKDREVVDYARRNDMLLITQDQKPANLANLVGAKCVMVSNSMIARIAIEQIQTKYPDAKPRK
jgi:predicted nuclease of predicted toxin-antitoxin system